MPVDFDISKVTALTAIKNIIKFNEYLNFYILDDGQGGHLENFKVQVPIQTVTPNFPKSQ